MSDKYVGAEFTGKAPLISPEFGRLEPGKIYPLSEERAKITDGFEPVYGDKKKERKVK